MTFKKITKTFLKKILAITVTITLFFEIDRILNKKKCIILMYHGVTSINSVRGSVQNYDGKQVYAATFNEQVRHLAKRYTILSLNQLFKAINNHQPLPANSVVITFDDGYLNNYHCAFPILKKYHAPATIFVCPDLIETNELNWLDTIEWLVTHTLRKNVHFTTKQQNHSFSIQTTAEKIHAIISIKKLLFPLTTTEHEEIISLLKKQLDVHQPYSENYRIMNWHQLKELSASNISIQSHSATHSILTSQDKDAIQQEIIQSKILIEKKLHTPVYAFAYPNGVYNHDVKTLLKQSGYTCAFAIKGEKNSIYPTQLDPFALKRIPVTNNYNNDIFMLNLIFNLHKILYTLRHWLR